MGNLCRGGGAREIPAGAGALNLTGRRLVFRNGEKAAGHEASAAGERRRMSETLNLPVVPMKNAVLFPGVSVPITAGRPATLRAIEAAMNDKDRRVFAVAQRQVTEGETVRPDSLFTIGTS